MADYIGRRVGMGVSLEAVRGTAGATPQIYIPFLEEDVMDKQEKVLNESALGVLDKNNDSAVVKEWGEGKLDVKVQSNNFGYLLYAALGSLSTAAGVAPGTYNHTFTRLNDNLSKTLTLWKKTPNEDLKFAGAMINTLEIEIVVGEYIKASASFITKKGASASSTIAYSVESEIEFTAKHVQLFLGTYGTAFATVAGGTAIPVKSIKISIDRMAEAYYETGQNTPSEIHTKGFDVAIEVEKRYQDLTYKALAQGNTQKVAVVKVANTDVTIGTGGTPTLQFNLPKVVVNEHEESEGLDDIAEESFTLQGLFDTASATQLEVVLTNITASYVGN